MIMFLGTDFSWVGVLLLGFCFCGIVENVMAVSPVSLACSGNTCWCWRRKWYELGEEKMEEKILWFVEEGVRYKEENLVGFLQQSWA